MTYTRPITLGGRTFDVPSLPLRINRVVYPLIRALSMPDDNPEGSSFVARVLAANGSIFAVSDAEMDILIEIAWGGASAAEKTLSRGEFDDLPISPVELLDAFFIVRGQTGVWVKPPAREAAGDEPEGEAQGAMSPRASTSTES